MSELSQVGMSERSEAMAGARLIVTRLIVTRLVVTRLTKEAS
ncbi:hypothetical protein HD597_008799 [Nonomuraea thailandensis]|uniref:Uncharacterized protein n=1 Tax=Nonomuraea thailandensis TaxID=1188745 RepID=A0A9X2K6T1_9ACTN|nr:hypothetical protein [Nonomuraea thailandensis]MCP2361779.1 hypothetical protein [Nonomuraea thailandensis]